jgi:serine/threonine protein phosphatase PrpC
MKSSNQSSKIKVSIREVVFCNEEEKSFCDVFVYEPENIEEQALGNLYIIGEVVNLPENSSYLINLLASIIKKEFYSKPKRSSLESLEASLHKANSTLSDLAEQGNVDWVGNLNMVCGSSKNRELHLSKVGNIRTLLVRNGQVTDIGKNVAQEGKTHPFRTFINIASGELETDDLVLFATPELFNVFSLEKIKQVVSSSENIDDLARTIQDSVEQEDNISSVGLLIIKVEEEVKEEELSRVKIPVIWETGEKEVVYTSREEKTEGIEKDVLSDRNRRKISLESIIKEYKEITRENLEASVQEQDSKEKKEDRHVLSLANKVNFLRAKMLTKNFSEKIMRNKITSLALHVVKETANKLKRTIHRIRQEKAGVETTKKIELISNRNKIFLVAFVLIFSLLAGNLILTDYRNKKKEEFNFYNNLLHRAEEKLNQAEEVLIYSDFNQARLFLRDAKSFALKVKNDYRSLNNNAAALLNKIQNSLDIIDFVSKVDSPKVALDLSQIGNINAKQVIKIGEYYYVYTSAKILYQIDFKSKRMDDIEIEAGSSRSTNFKNFRLPTPIEKTKEIIFLTDSNETIIFNVSSKEWNTKSTELLSNPSSIKDTASYSNYLYTLDPGSNQIYKYKRVLDGFGEGKPWITDTEANLDNAVSVAIDGYIYILRADGTVSKYLRGKKRDFSIEKPSDLISNPTEIYTRADLKNLYIVDPQKRRIVLYNKTSGKLVRQYLSKHFDNLKNIVVDDKEEIMYILNGKKIFEVRIEK